MKKRMKFLAVACLAIIFSFSVNIENTFACKGMWAAIDQVELTAPVSTITFDNISSDYKMLKLVINVGQDSGVGSQVRLRFNDDTNNNYKHYITSVRLKSE